MTEPATNAKAPRSLIMDFMRRLAGGEMDLAEAPDFELEMLTAQGTRSGGSRRLADHRGRPVALIFGSYT